MSRKYQNLQKLALALIVAGLLPFFQNCSNKGGQAVRFSEGTKSTSGNGQPYDGKPDPGDYYRVVPGFTCGTTPQASVAGKIIVTTTDVNSYTVNPDCSQTQKQLALADVDSSPLNRNNLGFRDGIFEKYAMAPAPTAETPETWCRSVNSASPFEFMIKRAANGTLTAVRTQANAPEEISSPAFTQSGNAVRYQDGAVRIDITLNLQGDQPGQVRGYVTHPMISGDVSCRSTVSPIAPTGGYLVLSANTTQGNFGGIAGARNFCLNQLLANDFKGKVNVMVDAAHVSAILCDSATCTNLNPNQSYTFAAAGAPQFGGKSFMSDAQGRGVGGTYSWNTPDVFGQTINMWMNRPVDNALNNDIWTTIAGTEHCNNWTTNNNTITGAVGRMDTPGWARWSNGGNICSDNNKLVCVVHAP